jgi:hypothetical protein
MYDSVIWDCARYFHVELWSEGSELFMDGP